jgi:5-methylcytosine-specific restriction endonuclease McrA
VQGLSVAAAHIVRTHAPPCDPGDSRRSSPPPSGVSSTGISSSGVSSNPSDALSCSVLVLNRLFMAVHVVNVRRAFGLLCRELAEVIHFEEGQFAAYSFDAWREIGDVRAKQKNPDDDWIRAVNFEIQAPRVIRLLRFDRLPKQKIHLSRRNVLARDDHQCQYCGRHLPTHLLSIDHVLPRSRGGETTWENVVCACLACNTKKGGRTPHEAHMKLLQKPMRPKRNPMLTLKLNSVKYESWRVWLGTAHWDVGARED